MIKKLIKDFIAHVNIDTGQGISHLTSCTILCSPVAVTEDRHTRGPYLSKDVERKVGVDENWLHFVS